VTIYPPVGRASRHRSSGGYEVDGDFGAGSGGSAFAEEDEVGHRDKHFGSVGGRPPRVISMSTPVGPYTPIVRAGDVLFTSGQIGIIDGAIVEGGIEAELRQVFVNLRGVLQSAGAGLGDVVKTTVFLVDMADYAKMNEIYVEEFGDHRPARSAVAVAQLPLGAQIEIEAIASI
jgi:2-iminobutanoate/2-iminopropanoate deaminase